MPGTICKKCLEPFADEVSQLEKNTALKYVIMKSHHTYRTIQKFWIPNHKEFDKIWLKIQTNLRKLNSVWHLCWAGRWGSTSSAPGNLARPTFCGRGGGGSLGDRAWLSFWANPGSEGFLMWPRCGGGGACFFRAARSLPGTKPANDGDVILALDDKTSDVDDTEHTETKETHRWRTSINS